MNYYYKDFDIFISKILGNCDGFLIKGIKVLYILDKNILVKEDVGFCLSNKVFEYFFLF